MNKKTDLPQIIHHPFGWHHPYEQEPYERTPRQPLAGETVHLNVATTPCDALDRLFAQWQLNGEDTAFQAEGSRKNQDGAQRYWDIEMPPFSYGDRVRYRIFGYHKGQVIQTDYYEFSVAGWIRTGALLRHQLFKDRLLLETGTEIPGLRLRQVLSVDDNHRLWLEWTSIKDGRQMTPDNPSSPEITPELDLALGQWRVCVQLDPVLLSIYRPDGELLLSEKHAAELLLDSHGAVKQLSCGFDSPQGEAFYGFGERFNTLNQRGQTLDVCVHAQFGNQGERTYIPIPFFVSSRRYGLYLDTSRRVYYDMAASQNETWSFQAKVGESQSLKACLIAKDDLWEVVSDFQRLTGRAALPPAWAFGLWMSSNDWNSQKMVMEQFSLTQGHQIPATVLVIEAWSDESTFYIWNDAQYRPKPPEEPFRLADFTFPPEGRWPDPQGMIDALHEAGIRVVLWQIPVLKNLLEADRELGPQLQHDADEAYMIEKGYCVHRPDGEPYHIPPAWFSGSLVMDFTHADAVEWWMSKRAYLLEEMGVDGFKTDGGEHLWGDDLAFHDGRTNDELWNQYPLLYLGAYSRLLQEYRGADRVLFSRSGFTGCQAFPCHWAGDEYSTWEAFRSSILAGLNLGISGVPFWGWDIAGFGGDLPDPDLYLRAAAMAVFCPILQYHSDFNNRRLPSRDRTPWNVQEVTGDQDVLPVFRKFANLRMNLVPYIASEALASCQTGLPMMRALALEYPQDQACADFPFQYLFGSSLLVAPLTTPDAGQLEVYLPQGEWVDFWTGEIHHGPHKTNLAVPRDRIPVFVRSGAILPLNLDETFTLSSPVGNSVKHYQNFCFKIFPHGESAFQWYDYTSEETRIIRCRESGDGKSVSVRLPAIPYPVHLILPGSKIESVDINGDKTPRVKNLHQLHNHHNAFFLQEEKNLIVIRVHPNQGARVAIQFSSESPSRLSSTGF